MAGRYGWARRSLALLLVGALALAWVLLSHPVTRGVRSSQAPPPIVLAAAQPVAAGSDTLLLDPVDLRALALTIRPAPLLPPPARRVPSSVPPRHLPFLAPLPAVSAGRGAALPEPPSFWLLWAAALGLSWSVVRAP